MSSSGSSTIAPLVPGRGRGRGRAQPLQSQLPPPVRTVGPSTSPALTGGTPTGGTPQRGSPNDRKSPISSSPERTSEEQRQLQLELSKIKLEGRPDHGGQSGRGIKLFSNHFQLKFTNGKINVQMYHIECKHDRRNLNKEETRLVFWKAIRDNRTIFAGEPTGIAFDGSKIAFSIKKFSFPGGVEDTYKVQNLDVQLPRDLPTNTSKCTVLWQYVGPVTLDLSSVTDPVISERQMTPIQVIDIVFRQSQTCPYMNPIFVPAGSSFYLMPEIVNTSIPRNQPRYSPVDLSVGRELWNGYFSSAHVLSGFKPWMNIDVSNTAFYKQMKVMEFAAHVITARNPRSDWGSHQWPPHLTLNPADRKLFEKEVKGLKIRIIHRENGQQQRVYRVTAVTTMSSEEVTFKFKDRESQQERVLTVADYFAQHYKPLQFKKLPCLQVGSKTRACFLPLEVCIIDRGQKCNKKLNETQTGIVVKNCALPAPVRFRKIQEMVKWSSLETDRFATTFGLKFEAKAAEINARVLQAPIIQYSLEGRSQGKVQTRDGTWRRNGDQPLFLPASCGVWGCIAFCHQKDSDPLQRFCNSLTNCARSMGLRFNGQPHYVKFARDATQLEPHMADMMQQEPKPQLILVVLPQKNTQLYSEVKRIAEITIGAMTQCVLWKNVSTAKDQTLENIVLKINLKLGGINNTLVADQYFRKMTDTGTIVFGVDVTHPGPFDKRSPSIAAIVANFDIPCTLYAATVKVQKHRRESIVYLTDAIRDRLLQYYQHTSMKPDRILVYRDGVSEGQFRMVLKEELKGIRDACMGLDSKYRPKITFVIVQKRHHVRLFCQNLQESCGKAQNVPPGTVVDQVVVHPTEFDFYLCSHFGIQGTSRPSHYYCIHDDNGYSSDELQIITYELCHLYGRCARAVSIPAPTYYADLVATRARYHLAKVVGDWGSDVSSISSSDDQTQTSIPESELMRGVSVKQGIAEKMYFA